MSPIRDGRREGARSSRPREHASRHLERLCEVSKALTSFASFDETVPEILARVGAGISLRSAVLVYEIEGRPTATLWHAPDAAEEELRALEDRARANYSYLVPEGPCRDRDLEFERRPASWIAPGPVAVPTRLFLPLVTDSLPIAGAIQLESSAALDPIDLAFVNATANQLAIALDRHCVWTSEIEQRRLAEALASERSGLLDRATAAVKARDEFIAIASHELTGPIAALHLHIEMVRNRYRAAAPTPEKIEKDLDFIERQTRKLSFLITELLDATRLSWGSFRLEMQDDVDLVEIVQEVLGLVRPIADRSHCPLSLELPGACPGRWDRVRLEQVVTNLLTNAIKFGGGQPIDVRLEAHERLATLEVRDRGVGIAPEDQARIFARYEQAGEGRRYSGLGLGLYISREIVERHGGRISVRSAPGEGSTFRVELPRGVEAVFAGTGDEGSAHPDAGLGP